LQGESNNADEIRGIGSRRLITYKRLSDGEISEDALAAYAVQRLQLQEAHRTGNSATANELNDFRKKVWNPRNWDAFFTALPGGLLTSNFALQYFEGFKTP
jgi:hypothetical protein